MARIFLRHVCPRKGQHTPALAAPKLTGVRRAGDSVTCCLGDGWPAAPSHRCAAGDCYSTVIAATGCSGLSTDLRFPSFEHPCSWRRGEHPATSAFQKWHVKLITSFIPLRPLPIPPSNLSTSLNKSSFCWNCSICPRKRISGEGWWIESRALMTWLLVLSPLIGQIFLRSHLNTIPWYYMKC